MICTYTIFPFAGYVPYVRDCCLHSRGSVEGTLEITPRFGKLTMTETFLHLLRVVKIVTRRYYGLCLGGHQAEENDLG